MMIAMQKMFGRIRGGLAVTVTIIGVLLAAATGIIGASVVLLGLLSLPAMLKQDYANPWLSEQSVHRELWGFLSLQVLCL